MEVFWSLPPISPPLEHPSRAPIPPAAPVPTQMASVPPSLRSHLSPTAIAQLLEGYSATGVLLCSEVQCEPLFDPDEIHMWLGWAGWTRTLVTLFDSYAQLLQSTSIPVPMSFSLQELSSITAHLDFGLTRLHDAPEMMFLSKHLYLWCPAYEPIPERLPHVDRELFRRVHHYLGLLHMHSGAQPRRTLMFGEVKECLMHLASLLFRKWVAENEEAAANPAPAYEGDGCESVSDE
ncbi:hypothetical protein OBBRIDRAFT_839030 [Obba rivulosa]|uniref:Uncharacterized protein n=1 Tax=Obba rivulosa TaxID=1052685 RepID=A0A8E2DFY7_9APHY|nr:hypothetical protein OBBRIDRAFT_839030 [Obba rivulosa]